MFYTLFIMLDLIANLNAIQQRIRNAEQQYHRNTGSVSLLAVSKAHSPARIATIADAGQRAIGENYLQEALLKISALSQKNIEWHFLGQLQTNKIREVAQNFSWIHTVSRLKEAEKLSQYRAPEFGLLNICIEIKLDDNPNKHGISPQEVLPLIQAVKRLPGLRLRGLMTIPPPVTDFEHQRNYFKRMKTWLNQFNDQGAEMDTLSMGMTNDFEAAIAEGATIVRIGTGIFGPRGI